MAIEISSNGENGEQNIIGNLSKSAIQALYHAVTGKTETLSKEFSKNVIITSDDIDRLYHMMNDQFSLYPSVVIPTTTVVVKNKNGKSTQYSTWERYTHLRVNNHEITSDFSLKFEMLIHLPDTATPQRCVVNITIDSSLPIIADDDHRSNMDEIFPFFFLIRSEWRTLLVSIDFVDFLVARSFISTTEEWFNSLPKTPQRNFSKFLMSNINIIRSTLSQSGRIGMASFLAGYAYFVDPNFIYIENLILAGSFGLFIWSTLFIIEISIFKIISRRIMKNIIPSVIILSEADKSEYSRIISQINSPELTALGFILSVSGSILLSVLSSYIYTLFSSG